MEMKKAFHSFDQHFCVFSHFYNFKHTHNEFILFDLHKIKINIQSRHSWFFFFCLFAILRAIIIKIEYLFECFKRRKKEQRRNNFIQFSWDSSVGLVKFYLSDQNKYS